MKKIFSLVAVFSIQICVASTYYVSPTGNHTSFTSPARAATNIQAAVNVATTDGDIIIIFDGTYHLSSAVSVAEGITLISQNGPAATIVDGNGNVPCFDLSDVGCVISGLTITNGFNSNDGGGVSCAGSTPVITNCIIVGNTAGDGGGILDGRVYNSLIMNNIATRQGGGCRDSEVHNSLIAGNRVSSGGDWGGGVENCTLYNCTVVDNSAPDTGGADSSIIYNSIIFSNSAPSNPNSAYSTLHYSCTTLGDEDSPDANTITVMPSFVDFSGGNYRLSSGSLCINAGDTNEVYGLIDLDGKMRIVELVDMGAYEYQATALDSDGDGLPDAWELAYFNSLTNLATGHGDADQFNNFEEYVAGTDPTNSMSYFAVTNWAVGGFILEWPVVTNRLYSVLWSTNLTSGFFILTNGIEHPLNSYTDMVHSVEDECFYKVRVHLK